MDQVEKVLEQIFNRFDRLSEEFAELKNNHDEAKKMSALASEVQPLAVALREACDEAEKLVADELWPLPKYREMLFANTLA